MDLSKAMKNLQEVKKANSKEIAEVAKMLREKKSLKEGIIDDLQKGKPSEKRDGSKVEIDKAVKEEKEIVTENEIDAVKSRMGVGMFSDEDQEKYYHDTVKDTNGTFYDRYKIDGKLYDVLGNEIKESCETCNKEDLEEEKKNLTELRHVEKKVIVKGYDFSELSEGIQERLIKEYFKNSGSRDSQSDSTPEDLIKKDIEKSFIEEVVNSTIFGKVETWGYLGRDTEEDAIEGMSFYCNCPLDAISKDLEWDETYYKSIEEDGHLGGRWGIISTEILKHLSKYTNYDELPKSTKREIISKLDSDVEKAKELVKVYREKTSKALEEISDSITDFKKLRNKPAIEKLQKFWYSEDGSVIISKDKAKIVEGEVNESLITEAPVNLEFDHGYDVYKYDDLSDSGKVNAFSSTERSRKNEYERTFNILKERITEMVETELSNVGLKIRTSTAEYDEPLRVISYNKGELDRVSISLDTDSLIEYAKSNNINLEPNENRSPGATLSIQLGSRKYFEVNLSNINAVDDKNSYRGYREDEEVRKQLDNELNLDLKGLLRKVIRIEKQFRDAIDDDFRNRMTTDKKLKRREYDKLGNVYKDKKNEK